MSRKGRPAPKSIRYRKKGPRARKMSSLIAWVAVDSRGPSSFYLASDSRICWTTSSVRWDAGRKLFASTRHPDVFGYCGDVLFPSLVLGQAVDLADHGVLFSPGDSASRKHEKLSLIVQQSFASYPSSQQRPFTIIHVTREHSEMASVFYLFRLDWLANDQWTSQTFNLPTQSGLVLSAGSGAGSVRAHYKKWQGSESARTSRSVFNAFCDSLRSADDPCSGGAPQLAGIYRTGPAESFGVVYDDRRSLLGAPVEGNLSLAVVEWRNNLFERCDGKTMARLEGAQPHGRPHRL